MKVVEIFSSIDGEGSRAGFLCTFIRLYGCNLRCNYCDSLYALENNYYTEMTCKEIINKCVELGNFRITLTGGEPLIHNNVIELIQGLLDKGFYVNIETNGSIDLTDVKFTQFKSSNLFYTVDYKCTGSGVNNTMCINNFCNGALSNNDIIKFVVSDEQDLKQMSNVVKHYINTSAKFGPCRIPQFYVSPVFGRIEPVTIVNYLKSTDEQNIRLQIQLHKIVWDPNEKGV